MSSTGEADDRGTVIVVPWKLPAFLTNVRTRPGDERLEVTTLELKVMLQIGFVLVVLSAAVFLVSRLLREGRTAVLLAVLVVLAATFVLYEWVRSECANWDAAKYFHAATAEGQFYRIRYEYESANPAGRASLRPELLSACDEVIGTGNEVANLTLFWPARFSSECGMKASDFYRRIDEAAQAATATKEEMGRQ